MDCAKFRICSRLCEKSKFVADHGTEWTAAPSKGHALKEIGRFGGPKETSKSRGSPNRVQYVLLGRTAGKHSFRLYRLHMIQSHLSTMFTTYPGLGIKARKKFPKQNFSFRPSAQPHIALSASKQFNPIRKCSRKMPDQAAARSRGISAPQQNRGTGLRHAAPECGVRSN